MGTTTTPAFHAMSVDELEHSRTALEIKITGLEAADRSWILTRFDEVMAEVKADDPAAITVDRQELTKRLDGADLEKRDWVLALFDELAEPRRADLKPRRRSGRRVRPLRAGRSWVCQVSSCDSGAVAAHEVGPLLKVVTEPRQASRDPSLEVSDVVVDVDHVLVARRIRELPAHAAAYRGSVSVWPV